MRFSLGTIDIPASPVLLMASRSRLPRHWHTSLVLPIEATPLGNGELRGGREVADFSRFLHAPKRFAYDGSGRNSPACRAFGISSNRTWRRIAQRRISRDSTLGRVVQCECKARLLVILFSTLPDQNAPGPIHRFPVYLRTSASPLVPSTSIQSRSRSKMTRQPGRSR
jgi:hypothetical protein